MNLLTDRILRRSWMLSVVVVAGGVAVALTGCGGSSGAKATAGVNGKVTFNGQPVTGGSIMFSPIASGTDAPGKAGSGSIQPDGTFKVSTYATNDGAVIGRHQVRFTAPAGEAGVEAADGHSAPGKPSPFEGLVPKTGEVEVKASGNDITVELVAGM